MPKNLIFKFSTLVAPEIPKHQPYFPIKLDYKQFINANQIKTFQIS